MGLNEQLKADLETGRMKFASAAAELQTIKDEIDQVAKNLSPEEQKWVGAASSDCQETLRAFDDASRDALLAMGDTAEGISQMRQGIIDAEKEAERAAKKEEIANIVILMLSVVYLPLAGEAAGGTLEAESASKAVKMLIDLDQKIAALFRRIAAAMKKIGKEFKTDLPEAETHDPIKVDPIVENPPTSIEPPTKLPTSEPAPTPEVAPPVETREAPEAEPPSTPSGTNNEAPPLKEPEAPTPAEKEARLRRCKESSMLAANGFAPNVSRNQPHQPGGKMKSQPYWTRQVVASMGVQEMCGFICKPSGKKACRPSWCLAGLTSSTLKVKCKVLTKTFPAKEMVWPTVAGPSGSLRSTWTSAENHSE